MNTKDCSFCDNIENQERTIFKDSFVWAFPTNIPIVPGHTLLCPVRCVATMDELTPEELQAFFDARKKMTRALRASFGAEGFNYAWNENKMAGQSVPHVHLHILPRKTGDAGVYQYEPRTFLYRPVSAELRTLKPQEELMAISKLIRSTLNSG